MSSMFLLKDHDLGKKNSIISTPFHIGKQLIAAGVARYWNGNSVAEMPKAVVEEKQPERLEVETRPTPQSGHQHQHKK